jgi:hypothetical protein
MIPLACFPDGSRRFEIGESQSVGHLTVGRHCVDFNWKIFNDSTY